MATGVRSIAAPAPVVKTPPMSPTGACKSLRSPVHGPPASPVAIACCPVPDGPNPSKGGVIDSSSTPTVFGRLGGEFCAAAEPQPVHANDRFWMKIDSGYSRCKYPDGAPLTLKGTE